MSTLNVLDLKGQGPFTMSILNPNVAADAAINFGTYFPKLDMEMADPIIYMLLEDTTDGSTTAEVEYTPNDRVEPSVGTGAGKYWITDEDTIGLGNATNTGGHTFRLHITAYWNRTKNN